MTRGWLFALIAADLLGLAGLVLVYPDLMVGPGPLVPSHAGLSTDCFACHAPFLGAASDRCVVCHVVPDIGLRTTAGEALPRPAMKASFHQELVEQNCMACHSDHPRPRLTRGIPKTFSHALLREATRDRCASCHAAPQNDIHRDLTIGCGSCHQTESWKPASFDHEKLAKADLDHCETCHKPPADSLHRQVKGGCAQCHSPKGWTPATFEHDALFRLDGAHDASCATCHTADDYSRYTCYGCHEHTPAKVRAEHEEEGIRDFENCVKCHRGASGERD